jgi:hypothetical protein
VKQTLYIAGPMTGLPHHNFPLFFKAERMLKKLGYKVVNPARMDVEAGELTVQGEVRKQVSARTIARRDVLAILDKCDGIVLLPGWKHSKGARTERALAEWMNMSIFSYKTLCGRRKK